MRNFFVYKILVLTLLALCCVCFKAYAGFETIADTVEVTPGNRSLIVMASYSGDDDANNSLQVEWGENGEDFSLGSQVLPHRESPYAYSIEDLDVRKSYQVRVTYLDDNEPDPDATLLAQVPNNPLVHNSISTGSDKWDGAWGVEDGKYGKFGCGACHKSNSGNIKRVRKMLTAPNGSDQFPIEADGFEVIFSSAAEGASDFGDDENGHATSQKICESCHTITNFHRYDTGAQASLSHYNRSDCMDCHKHNNGFAHGQGSGSGCGDCHGVDGGAGTVVSHSTHTEGDLDDQRGPQLACDYCHESDKFPNFNSGVDLNGDNKIDLSETDVCDACHSAQGSYDGVNDLILGAKANWDDGVYDGAALKAGKEKWCATCHDESPSIIDSIAAPNVIGDEDGAYTYSTVSPGYGYYKTGHGLSTDESYPASGGVVSGGGLECDACHDYSSVHTDSLARTFDCSDGCDADEYRSSYRLLQVGGENPMQIPWTGGGLDGSSFRLCSQTSCHPSGPFTDSANPNTNLKSWATVEVEPGVWEDRWTNRHVYHLGNVFSKVPADYDPVRFSELSWNSRMVCVTCHNVHGSTQLAMVRDGKLIDREPGLPIWYSNDLLTSTETTPPQPADLPLSASNGSVWTPKTAGNLCSGCHGGNPLTTISREPFQDLNQAPRLAWVGGAGYSSDGVNPDNGPGSSSFYFQVNYSDDNNHLPLAIEVWIDRNDDGDYLDLDEKLALTPAAAADINVMDGKVYERIVTLDKAGDNSLAYRFYASDGTDAIGSPTVNSSLAIVNVAPALSWTEEAAFAVDGVNPNVGGDGASYEFRVRYSEAENEAPTAMQLWIDADDSGSYQSGEKHDMTEIDGADSDYVDGKLYSYTTVLGYVGDGAFNYRFYATEGISVAGGDPVTDSIVTVQPTPNNPPYLNWATGNCMTEGVRPGAGAARTEFEFLVEYLDADDECPSAIEVWIDENDDLSYDAAEKYALTEVDAADTTCSDGKLYSRQQILALAGDNELSYRFYASDGSDAALGQPVLEGGAVTIIDGFSVRPAGSAMSYDYSSIYTAMNDQRTIIVYPNDDFSAATYHEYLNVGSTLKDNRTIQSACGADLTIVSSPSGNTILIQSDANIVYDGLSITSDDYPTCTGAGRGVVVNGIDGTPAIIRNSKIYRNCSSAIYLNNTSGAPVIVDNVEIFENKAAAMVTQNGSILHLKNSEVHSQHVTGSGAVVVMHSGPVTIENSVIHDNSSTSLGGVIANNRPDLTITNSLFYRNHSGSGGVLSSNNNAKITITNSTFADNTATNGGAIYVCSGDFTIRNSVFWNNSATKGDDIAKFCGEGNLGELSNSNLTTANLFDATFDGEGNIDPAREPLFVDEANDDYHLQALSPLIDQGNSAYAPAYDIDGDSRPSGSAADMGVDEVVVNAENNAPTLFWTGESAYLSDGVDPQSAPGLSTFSFRVDYSDADNDAPALVQLWLDLDDDGAYSGSEKFLMSAVDGADNDYSDGKRYSLDKAVAVAGDGAISYRFSASDGYGEAAGAPVIDQSLTVLNSAPFLSWTGEANYLTDGVNPDSATGGDSYAFQIDFSDADNLPPQSIQVWIDLDDSSSYEAGEKFDLAEVDAGDSDYNDGKRYQYSTTIYFAGDGALNYRFYASDGAAEATGAATADKQLMVVNNAPLLAWTGEASYLSDGVDPDSGDNGDTFSFRIDYFDADNTPPSAIEIWIDEDDSGAYEGGEKYALAETDGADQNYLDGKRYSLLRVLPFAGDGQYSYRFYATDGVADAAGAATTDSPVTVNDVSNSAPILSWTTGDCLDAGVRPGIGATGSDFEFTVNYSDSDNHCAATIEVWVDENDDLSYGAAEKYALTETDAGDSDCSDGKLYQTTRSLSLAGDNSFNYRFYADDGLDPASGGPVTGSSVAVVDAAIVRPASSALSSDYNSVIAAINAASGNILVYPEDDFSAATYSENVTMYNKDDRIVQSACGADATIISSASTGHTVTVQDSANFVLDGFSITGATNSGASASGFYINRVDATTATIRNSKVYGNYYGFYINEADDAPVLIENVEIFNNSGRGISSINADDDFDLVGGSIHSHNVTLTGAAISSNDSATVTISGTVIRDNVTSAEGGALYVNKGSLTVSNAVFADNQGLNGGVLRSSNGPTVSFVNSTFSGNSASNQGGVLYICQPGSHTVRNSIFWGNSAGVSGDIAYKACSGFANDFMTVTDSNISTSGSSVGNGTLTVADNIDPAQDPLFVDAANDDYHLLATSPVINQANSAYAPEFDIDRQSRPQGVADDMGADEYAP